MFSVALQFAFPTNSHDEQTYRPRSTWFDFVSSPPREQVFEVSHSFSFKHLDATYLAFEVEVLVDAVERPRVQLLVSRLPPVRLTHVLRPTHRECANTAFDTLGEDGVRENVVEMRFAVSELPACPHRLLRRAVLSFGVVLRLGEVVFVLFERVTGEQDVFVGERDRGNVLDAEVDSRSPVTC